MRRSLRDTLPEILLIKMTIAFSLNIWYFLMLFEQLYLAGVLATNFVKE